MSAATQNEMERLERVNREHQQLLDQVWKYVDQQGLAQLGQSRVMALIEAHRQVAAESDALAAHVERLHMAWVDAKRCVSVVAFPALYRVEQYQHLAKRSIEKLESVVSDTPTTSLARLKAQAKAEAFENLANYEGHWTQRDMEAIASDYRRQAEEPSP